MKRRGQAPGVCVYAIMPRIAVPAPTRGPRRGQGFANTIIGGVHTQGAKPEGRCMRTKWATIPQMWGLVVGDGRGRVAR